MRTASTERDVDLAYRNLVEGLIDQYGIKTLIGLTSVPFIEGEETIAQWIENLNEVDTVGSMQVSVAFALKNTTARQAVTRADFYRMRDFLYTRRGGMYYGIMQLLGYRANYRNKLHYFADFNAGRFSSRNAAFQLVLSKLLPNSKLVLDGDLLTHDFPKLTRAHIETVWAVADNTCNHILPLLWTILLDSLSVESNSPPCETKTINIRKYLLGSTGRNRGHR